MAQDDKARRERIIRHMNADHQDSLEAFARHYASVPSSSAANALLSDITFSTMSLTLSNGDKVSVPINPPMGSWNEARERLKAMAEEAATDTDANASSSSSVKVKRFVWPTPFGWLIVFLVCLAYYTLWHPSHLARGTFLRTYYLMNIHPLADIVMEYGAIGWWMILAIHSFETVVLWTTRLRKNKAGSDLALVAKFLWMMGTMTEGFGTFVRFDKEVRRLKKEKAK